VHEISLLSCSYSEVARSIALKFVLTTHVVMPDRSGTAEQRLAVQASVVFPNSPVML